MDTRVSSTPPSAFLFFLYWGWDPKPCPALHPHLGAQAGANLARLSLARSWYFTDMCRCTELASKLSLKLCGPGRSRSRDREGREPGDYLRTQPTQDRGPGASLSASSRQLRCIAYSCSRVSGSEAVKRCSSSDFIQSWYLWGQRDVLRHAGSIEKHEACAL